MGKNRLFTLLGAKAFGKKISASSTKQTMFDLLFAF